MAGLALSTVFLFALLLPGAIVYTRYVKITATSMISSANEISTTWVLGAALFLSLFLHAFWGLLLYGLSVALSCDSIAIDYRVVSSLLLGKPTEWMASPTSGDAWFLLQVFFYIATMYGVAWAGGNFLGAYLEDKKNWSYQRALEDNGAMWHSLLYDRVEELDALWDVVVLTLKVPDDKANGSSIIRGFLVSFDQDQNGDLIRVCLTAAAKRRPPPGLTEPAESGARQAGGSPPTTPIEEEDAADDTLNVDGWTLMPGEYFVASCRQVQTIAVDYFSFENVDNPDEAVIPESAFARFKRRIKGRPLERPRYRS